MNEKKLHIGSTTFKNPVFLASGPAGYGIEYGDLINLEKLGAVVTKTISLMPKEGNPGTRLKETRSGLLNSVGLENVGAETFFSEKLPELLDLGVKPVVSLACESNKQYLNLLELVAREGRVDAVELNLSCPNVDEGGMVVGTDPESLRWYVSKAKEILESKTVLAKLTPNVGDIAPLAVISQEAGADGITAINTILGMDIDLATGKPVFDRITAGLSGPAIMPVALRAVWQIVQAVDIPVVGVGGISSVKSSRKFFAAGASAVQIGTALFYDPGLPERIIDSL
ncbi:MAG TPA: dihydroorotate dehydrogenase [Candidatus Krumholzibacteriaceae bacterium]|nr:dihydroorotate dehydrogenase [Candidatus Krumholzibacteriaceae bacterium]